MIRKLKTGGYRLYSRKTDKKTGKRKNLGTFKTRAAAEKQERLVGVNRHVHSGARIPATSPLPMAFPLASQRIYYNTVFTLVRNLCRFVL